MRLTIIGCAGSYPGPDSAASAYLVQARDESGRGWSVLLDLGSGAFGPLQQYIDPFDLDAVALTHLHPDHYFDLAALYVYRRYHPTRRQFAPPPLTVYGPFGTASRLVDAYGAEEEADLTAEFTIMPWQAGTPVQVGPLLVEPQAVYHPVPAYGVRVTGPSEDDPQAEVTLAYSGDTDLCAGLITLAEDADLLLAEAAFVDGRDTVAGIHMTGRDAGRAAATAQVGRLVLTHIPGWNDPEIARSEAAAEYAGQIAIAAPGVVYEL